MHSVMADDLVRKQFDIANEPIVFFTSNETKDVNAASLGAVRPKLVSPELRIEDMDAGGIDLQVISPSPFQYFYWADPLLGRDAAQTINDWIAAIVRAQPDRFAGLCTIPLQAPELAIAEMQRAVGQLGFKGVEIGSNVAGEDLSHEKFRPFFARAEELGILIFIHPNGFPDGRRFSVHNLINLVGNPLDSTLAISHLIFGGVLDAYPKLKICVAHGGGFLPAYSGRMDHAYSARPDCRLCISRPPSAHLASLYFDSVVYTPHQLRYLVERYGFDHILLGTDYPYDMAEPDPVGLVRKLGLEQDHEAAILGGNAARLLNLGQHVGKPHVSGCPTGGPT
jgi:aminocarboxymuconate-semialdehyde decarboxylase